MKLLRILIYSIIFLLVLTGINTTHAQKLSLRAGIYDFTENLATEFYLLAPGIFIGYDILSMNRLKFNTSLGFAFNSIKYNNHKHSLYLVPVFFSLKYELTNPDSKFKPYFGGGLSLAGKADMNKYFDKTHYAFTYGYHGIGGIYYRLNNKLSLQLDLRYNLLLNPVMDEINISGMVSSVGLAVLLGQKKNNLR